MLFNVAFVGVGFLVGLAVAIGFESGSQGRGWRGLAEGRRRLTERSRVLDEREASLAEDRRQLWAWEGEIIAAAASDGCPVCELRRRRGGKPSAD